MIHINNKFTIEEVRLVYKNLVLVKPYQDVRDDLYVSFYQFSKLSPEKISKYHNYDLFEIKTEIDRYKKILTAKLNNINYIQLIYQEMVEYPEFSKNYFMFTCYKKIVIDKKTFNPGFTYCGEYVDYNKINIYVENKYQHKISIDLYNNHFATDRTIKLSKLTDSKIIIEI